MSSMTSLMLAGALFADRNQMFRDLGSGFRGSNAKFDTKEIGLVLLACTAAVIVFWLLSKVAVWREGRGPFNDPKQLFKALCREHRLSRAQRHLLLELAGAASLPSPVEIFLRPDLVEAALRRPELAEEHDDLSALKAMLFS